MKRTVTDLFFAPQLPRGFDHFCGAGNLPLPAGRSVHPGGQYVRRPPSPQGVSIHDLKHEFQRVLSHFVCGGRGVIKEMHEHMMPRLYLQDRILKPFNLFYSALFNNIDPHLFVFFLATERVLNLHIMHCSLLAE